VRRIRRQGRLQALADEVMVLRPREIVAAVDLDLSQVLLDGAGDRLPVTRVEPWTFEHESARRTLLDQFRTNGSKDSASTPSAAVSAAGACSPTCATRRRADLAHVAALPTRRRPTAS
jgi:DNA mismatch repair ATPase MutS